MNFYLISTVRRLNFRISVLPVVENQYEKQIYLHRQNSYDNNQ